MPAPLAITSPLPIVRYTYYIFIFSIPIETLDIGLESQVFSLSKLTGIMFIATALLQPQICFKKPPRPFWYFLGYVLIYLCLSTFQPRQLMPRIANELSTLVLMLILFWISFNLLQDKRIVKPALLMLVGSCVLLAVLMLTGSGMVKAQGRMTALSQNANVLAATFSLGLLALLGLAYGRNDYDGRMSFLLWLCFGGLALAIVFTGSRGPVLGLFAGILLLAGKRGDSALKVQVGFLAVCAIGVLVWASYENDAVRLRWERAFNSGDLARREAILPEAWNMFTEKPLLGWGPVSHYMELGTRFGRPVMDPHNDYLWILNETGLLGGIPFLSSLWLCWRAGWRATQGTEGSLPIAMLTCLFIANMSGSMHYRKLFWIVLAYSLASESLQLKRWQLAYSADSIEKHEHPVWCSLQRR